MSPGNTSQPGASALAETPAAIESPMPRPGACAGTITTSQAATCW